MGSEGLEPPMFSRTAELQSAAIPLCDDPIVIFVGRMGFEPICNQITLSTGYQPEEIQSYVVAGEGFKPSIFRI